ncbi:hypothetical protein BCR35DRAFT_336427 [Leucosporidium creatinivorum]|uniref:Uncharacterized protein n=1 Tax=Leucosporidium creatinivorum TaxID=106004 RepID=A0A1Y2C4D0_9BASI|nr:hypothetical protein BCR35DRAFT_336427 [Leucosporidium creatinivorum]
MGATSSKQSTGVTVGVIVGCLVIFLIVVFFAVRLIQRRMSPLMSGLKPASSDTILPLSSPSNLEQRTTSPPPLYDSPAFASGGEDPAKSSGGRRRGEGDQGWTDGAELLYNGASERGDSGSSEKMEVR